MEPARVDPPHEKGFKCRSKGYWFYGPTTGKRWQGTSALERCERRYRSVLPMDQEPLTFASNGHLRIFEKMELSASC